MCLKLNQTYFNTNNRKKLQPNCLLAKIKNKICVHDTLYIEQRLELYLNHMRGLMHQTCDIARKSLTMTSIPLGMESYGIVAEILHSTLNI